MGEFVVWYCAAESADPCAGESGSQLFDDGKSTHHPRAHVFDHFGFPAPGDQHVIGSFDFDKGNFAFTDAPKYLISKKPALTAASTDQKNGEPARGDASANVDEGAVDALGESRSGH